MDRGDLATINELAQRARATDVEMSESTCLNLSKFKAVLRQLRKVDDNIMLRLNNTNTASREDCLALFNALQTTYLRRSKDIDTCVAVLDRKLSDTDHGRLFSVRAQRDWVANERSVESIIRRRSLDVLGSRCQFDFLE
ncbi:hypothetical protein IWW39_000201 [Coemansia spiralis]|uniref:Uncharacterized protein n=1 Tax=Coemansia spiralis TaxID=417178 RepID=A0A9W8GQH5_9FUNG|nr:hypothetical protein GGI06_006226 [Coemansia sp. S85]KAJ2691141.1 hypothetical protein IWW39_000201 [Coemansia spiralis]